MRYQNRRTVTTNIDGKVGKELLGIIKGKRIFLFDIYNL